MFNIGEFLQKTLSKVGASQLYKKNIADVVEKHTTIKLGEKDFDVKNGVVMTTLSPLQKNVILIKKEGILRDLAEFKIRDIR